MKTCQIVFPALLLLVALGCSRPMLAPEPTPTPLASPIYSVGDTETLLIVDEHGPKTSAVLRNSGRDYAIDFGREITSHQISGGNNLLAVGTKAGMAGMVELHDGKPEAGIVTMARLGDHPITAITCGIAPLLSKRILVAGDGHGNIYTMTDEDPAVKRTTLPGKVVWTGMSDATSWYAIIEGGDLYHIAPDGARRLVTNVLEAKHEKKGNVQNVAITNDYLIAAGNGLFTRYSLQKGQYQVSQGGCPNGVAVRANDNLVTLRYPDGKIITEKTSEFPVFEQHSK